jgi:hypothetical protein
MRAADCIPVLWVAAVFQLCGGGSLVGIERELDSA